MRTAATNLQVCRTRCASEVFADGDEFHLGRDDAAARIMHLRHAGTWLRAQRRATQRGKIFEAIPFFFLPRLVGRIKSQIAIVDRLQLASLILLHIAARKNPMTTQRRQTFTHIAIDGRIAPWPTRVVNTHRRVLFERVVEVARLILRDLAKRNTHAGLFAVDVDAARIGQRLIVVWLDLFRFRSV